MATALQGTVGLKGDNNAEDVEAVQTLLNTHAKQAGYSTLKVDGIAGKRTIEAIKAFQLAFVPKVKPNGLVQKGRDTYAALHLKPSDLAKGESEKWVVHLDKKAYEFDREKEMKAFLGTLKQINVNGKLVTLTAEQYTKVQKQYLLKIHQKVVVPVLLRAQATESIWNNFSKISRDHLFASWCVESWGPKLPAYDVVSKAKSGKNAIMTALGTKDLQKTIDAIAKHEPTINKCYETMFEYRKSVTKRTDGWITGLNFTKTASFTIVAAIAAPQLVVAGATTGQAAFLVGVGTAALPSIGNEIGKVSAGTSGGAMDAMYNIGIDSAIGGSVGLLLKGKAGTACLDALEKRLLRSLASSGWFKQISSSTLKKWLAGYLKSAGRTMVEDAIKTVASRVGKGIKGETYTKEKFFDDVADVVKGAMLAGFMNPFEVAIEKKLAPAIYKAVMNSNTKVTIKELTGSTKKVPLSEMFGGLPKDKATKAIQGVISGSGSSVVGGILDWGMGKFTEPNPTKAVEKTGSQVLASPQWAKLMPLIVKEVQKKTK